MTPWRVPYPKFGEGPGLDRVTAVAARLGVDLARFGQTGAVIVGSNGKGSTAAMTAALLGATGRSVGLFTSPHLFDLNERFRIGDEDTSDDTLGQHWDRVRAAIDGVGLADTIGGFEFLFLIAADFFSAQRCDCTVWEAGLGGRLDPVRLVGAKRVALTSLDLEHTSLLGDTIEAIAKEKIAAAPKGAKVFAGESCAPYWQTIDECVRTIGAAAQIVPAQAEAPLPGAFQRENAALALVLARDLAPLNDTDAARGFAITRWPGRLEQISDDPLTVIDVGHTPRGVAAALQGFLELSGERPRVLVCGVSADKEAASIADALAPAFPVIICAAAHHKGAPAAQIAAHARAANPSAEIVIADSVTDARRQANVRARANGGAVYVAGGLFLAAEYAAVDRGRDPSTLAFF